MIANLLCVMATAYLLSTAAPGQGQVAWGLDSSGRGEQCSDERVTHAEEAQELGNGNAASARVHADMWQQ